jgi:hypothetical protein
MEQPDLLYVMIQEKRSVYDAFPVRSDKIIESVQHFLNG